MQTGRRVTSCHFCGREFHEGDRQHAVMLVTDWGRDDERDQSAKQALFHSFECLSAWAARLAADHDNRVVRSGNPDEQPDEPAPTVDTQTNTLIRKD